MAAKDVKKIEGAITGVYKVNLHCPQCARKIKRPLLRTEGVQSVDVDFEKNEIKVKGVIEVVKIHKLIEKLSKKKVELISPQIKEKETEKEKEKEKESAPTDQKKTNETKEPSLRSTSVKVHMHCDKCEQDMRKKLLKHRGIYTVKTDMKAQTLTVQGSIESDKLVSYLRKKVHKHAEIITPKPDKKEEKKEKEKVEVNATESNNKIIEFKEEVKVEVKSKESNVPYFIHYVYAPQLFSDENPNACFIM